MKSAKEVERELRDDGILERFECTHTVENPDQEPSHQTDASLSDNSDYMFERPQKKIHE